MNNNVNKIITISTSLGAFIMPFMSSAINIALPAISKEFALNSLTLNWVALSYTLSVAIFILPSGRLADIVGRKKIFMLGLSLFVFSTLLCAISQGAVLLIIARILQGISAAAIAVTVVSILTSVFPAGSRGKALGLNVAMTYTGLSVGPYLGGLLTKHFGWRSVFVSSTIIAILVLVALCFLKQEWSESKGEKMDFFGSAIFGLALIGIIAGFSSITQIWGIVLVLAGTALIIVFAFYEKKAAQPVLNMDLFKNNRVLVFSSLAALANYSATFALSYLLSLYLQYVKGYEPSYAGLVLMAQPIIMMLFSPLAGLLSDKIEPLKVASIGMGLTTIGLFMFIFLNAATPVLFIIVVLIIMGFGFALFSSPNTNAIMSSVDKKYYGITSGILGAARTVGQTLSMGIASMVIAVHMGAVQINSNIPALLTSVRTTFIIMTILCFAGIFASAARGKMHG